MRQESLNFLKTLLNTPSPSGFEEKASDIWCQYLIDLNFEIHRAPYGNSMAVVNKNCHPRILISGHIDEVGFMIKYISDEGFLYVSSIGGVDPYIMPAHKVTIHNSRGPVPGVIGQKPIHLLDGDGEREVEIHNIFIDIGALDKEDALRLVSVGDSVTFDSEFSELANGKIVARGLDDKMGAWCVAEVLRRIKEDNVCQAEVWGLASIQEENGMYGALMGVEKVAPDLALAIDVAHSTDVPNISKEKWGDVRLGEGPVITLGSVVNKSISNSLIEIADNKRIPFQIQTESQYSGTDADAFFTKRGGIPTGLVGVPNRYMHSPVEVIQISDLEYAVDLIVAFCNQS